jgi:hypothetical protein
MLNYTLSVMKTISIFQRQIIFIAASFFCFQHIYGQASIGLSGYTQNFDGLNVAIWTFPSSGATTTPDYANANNSDKTISTQGGAGAIGDVAGLSTRATTASNWASGSGAKFWQIEINTIGYTGVTLSSKQRSSGSGPRNFRVQYKIGAGTWTNAGANITVADNWTTGVLNSLSLPAACNNQSSVFIRWIMRSNDAVSGGNVANAGTSFIDDIIITSTNLAMLSGWNYYAIPGDNQSWGVAGIPLSGNPSAASTAGNNNTFLVNNNAEIKEYRSSSAYNLANSTTPANRSIGTSPTGVAAGAFQLALLNNSGLARNSINISYQIRRFATPTYFSGSSDNRLPGYQLFYSMNNGSTWVNVATLNPTITNVPNTVGVSNMGCTSIALPSTLAVGGEIRFRWIDDNSDLSSPDQVIGLDSININFATCGTLPVHLTQFNANMLQSVASLSWFTEGETAFSHFELERSIDGTNDFKKISHIVSGSSKYQYADNLKNISGNTFAYRLKMVDQNQSFTYSNIVVVRKTVNAIQNIAIAPNPVVNKAATLQFQSADASDIQIRILDLTGRVMIQQQSRVNIGMNNISLQNIRDLRNGYYILQVVKDKEINSIKFSVN